MNLLIAVILSESRDAAAEDDTTGPQAADDWEKSKEKISSASSHDPLSGEMDGPNSPSPRNTKWPDHYSLLVFGPHNGFRRACNAIATSATFEQFIMAAILVSSACLAVDTPRLDAESDLKATIAQLDLLFTAVFVGEMLIKMVALGVCGNGACERSRTPPSSALFSSHHLPLFDQDSRAPPTPCMIVLHGCAQTFRMLGTTSTFS